ncbi:MAG TPA: hypothetical protein VF163_20315 [Micromonosporaceae bacterium]
MTRRAADRSAPSDRPPGPRTGLLAVVILVSWLGFAVHNAMELPAPVWLRPDTIGPTAVYLLLGAGMLSPWRRPATWLLLGWGWLQAVGGGVLSVLPLPLWPFQPERSLPHYVAHAIYAAAQVPLLVALTRARRRRDPVPAGL